MKRLFLTIFLVLWHAPPVWAQATLTLNTFAGPPLSRPDRHGYYDRILSTAFKRLHIPINIGHLPAERSLQNANSNIDDGDFVRIAGLEKLYPNLIMVPESIDTFEFVAFTRGKRFATTGWDSLAPYHVGIVRGWKILEVNLRDVRKLIPVKNQELLFTLLKNGRADVVVYERKEGYGLLRQLGITDAVALSPPLATRAMHLYLNKKHTDLTAPLAAVLKTMKENGTYAAIAKDTLIPPIPTEQSGAHP